MIELNPTMIATKEVGNNMLLYLEVSKLYPTFIKFVLNGIIYGCNERYDVRAKGSDKEKTSF